MISKTEKKQIDDMTYYDMMRRHRFLKVGDRQFQGERGNYFMRVMHKKRRQVGDERHSEISKEIGWDE